MKLIPLVMGVMCAALVAACSREAPPAAAPTPASGTGTPRPVVSSHEGFARVVGHFDQNGDGLLELYELPPRLRNMLTQADTNNDGILTEHELDAFGYRIARRMFQAMDDNHDGALTQQETGDRIWERIEVADFDGDGRVTWQEFTKAHDEGKLHPPRRMIRAPQGQQQR